MLLLALLLSTSTPVPWSTGESAGDDLSIKVVTFGPGDDITEWFGHAALVVEDKQRHVSRLYNYGEYSFDETMVRRYVMGHLTFSVGERPVEKTLQLYAAHDRDVRLQELSLSPAQKKELARLLAENVKPENRHYLYDHYADNCTTRIRDVLDVVTGGQLKAQVQPGTRTLRQLTREKTAVSPAVAFVIDVILNASTDQPLTTWEEAFLPEEFERQLAAAAIVDETGVSRPLVMGTSTYWLSTREKPPPAPLSTWALLAVGLVVGAFVFTLRKSRVAFGLVVGVFSGVAGVVGSALFAMALFTDHHVTFGNLNLLLVSPLTLVVALAALVFATGRPLPLRLLAGLQAALAVVAVVVGVVGAQDTGWQLAVFVPLWLAVAAGAHHR